jgi:hypothetical protein
MTCAQCEEKISDYLENTLDEAERGSLNLHFQTCRACSDLLAGIAEVIEWGKTFPVYAPPPWLAPRIVANTPRVAKETWLDTLASIGRWFIEPRTAMAIFTATLVIGWMGSLARISPRWSTVFRNPSAIYYGAGDFVNRAYDRAIRSYYHAPFVTQIQSQIERLREIS